MEEKTTPNEWVMKVLTDWEKDMPDSISKSSMKAIRRQARNDLEKYKQIKIYKLRRWQREWITWLIKYMREIVKFKWNEKEATDEKKSNRKTPSWLDKAETEAAQAWAPTMDFRALKNKQPMDSDALILGKMFGHEFATWHEDNPGLAVSFEKLKPEQRLLLEVICEDQRAKRLEYVKKVVAIASQQSFEEASQFFKGYALATERGSLTDNGELIGETKATNIYGMLAMYSDFVPLLQNVRELYEWLQTMLGKNLIDDINGFKRVEKICERIGLAFRAPGRPRTRW